jgi:non-heme chloroperoxidase
MSMLLPAGAVELPNRVKLSYTEQGDADGTPLILLHGLTDSMRSFEPLLAHLPDSIHAYALSQRGHGDSEKPSAAYAANDFAGDVVAFMDEAGIERAIIAGHSMGSWVAGRVAVAYPERTLGLVLMGAFAWCRDRPYLVELLDSLSTLGDPVDVDFVREWQESTLARPVPAGFLDMVIAESRKAPLRVWQAALAGMIDSPIEAFDAVRAPALLAWGERDALVPRADQDEIAAALPVVRQIVYGGGGHAFHWEEPERVAADLVDFISGVAA